MPEAERPEPGADAIRLDLVLDALEPVPVADVVEEVLDLVRPMAAGRDIALPAAVPAEVCAGHVRADRQCLKQVLLNLFTNAVKSSHDGGRVTFGCQAVRDHRLRLAVGDTGPGISDAQRALLFSPFERLGADQEAGPGGTGLGLALAQGLVEAMGGAIGVDSTPGQGSVFWVELAAVEAPSRPPARQPGRRPPPEDGPARTVLYVEDNRSNVALVERVLARRPEVRLLVALEGGVGLELAKERQPDLVLLDMHLPDLSGEVVLQRLRAEPRTRDIPVVMLSADATPGQVERLLAAGAADYLTKPFDVTHLLRLVDGLAGPGAASAAADTVPATDEEAPLDWGVLDALGILDDDRLGNPAQLVALYLTDTAARLAELREALAKGDIAATADLAHNIKGTSATYGAARLARLCGELEQVAEDGDLAPSFRLLAGLEEEFERVRAALRSQFPDLAG